MLVIDIEKAQSKSLQVIEQLLRKTAGLPHRTLDAMPQSAIVPFNAYRMPLPHFMILLAKNLQKTPPIIRGNAIISNAQ